VVRVDHPSSAREALRAKIEEMAQRGTEKELGEH
jgi:hypothetical protein